MTNKPINFCNTKLVRHKILIKRNSTGRKPQKSHKLWGKKWFLGFFSVKCILLKIVYLNNLVLKETNRFGVFVVHQGNSLMFYNGYRQQLYRLRAPSYLTYLQPYQENHLATKDSLNIIVRAQVRVRAV